MKDKTRRIDIARLARWLVQVIALTIFAYQMTLALAKYLSNSTIPSVEYKDVKDTNLPALIVCREQQDQFGLYGMHAVNHGYTFADFLQGYLGTSSLRNQLSWGGYHNDTYANMTRQLFNPVPSDYISGFQKIWKTVRNNSKEIFTAFNGFCHKYEMSAGNMSELGQLYIDSNKQIEVFFEDPGKSLYYRINSEIMTGDAIITGNMTTRVYTIDLEEVNWLPDGGICADYKGATSGLDTYAQCIEHEQQEIFYPILGCMVPWLAGPDNQHACQGPVIAPKSKQELIWNTIHKYKLSREVRVPGLPTSCLKPCREMRVNARLEQVNRKLPGIMKILLNFNRQVKATRYLPAYGLFDLVVEVGSSLGLWIGLSGLELYDLVIQTAKATTKIIFNFTTSIRK